MSIYPNLSCTNFFGKQITLNLLLASARRKAGSRIVRIRIVRIRMDFVPHIT